MEDKFVGLCVLMYFNNVLSVGPHGPQKARLEYCRAGSQLLLDSHHRQMKAGYAE